jgi:hypothetical protein
VQPRTDREPQDAAARLVIHSIPPPSSPYLSRKRHAIVKNTPANLLPERESKRRTTPTERSPNTAESIDKRKYFI